MTPSTLAPLSPRISGVRDIKTPAIDPKYAVSRADVITAFRKKVLDDSLGSRRQYTSHFGRRN